MNKRITVLKGVIAAVVVIITTLTFGLSLSTSQSKSEVVKPLDVNILIKDSEARLERGQMITLPLTVIIGSEEQSPIITLDSAIVTNNGAPYQIAEGLSSTEDKATLETGGHTMIMLTIRADPTVKEGTYFLRLEASDENARSSSWYFPVEVTAT